MRLENRVALITGAGSKRGIGRAIALGFAREGAAIAVADIDLAGAQETAEEVRGLGGKAIALQADVSNSGDVARMVDETVSALGNINILVNNAGFCRFVPFLDVSEELWDRTMAINLKGYFLVGQAVAKQMVAAAKGGKIINISSMSAEVAGEEKVHYCASKGAVKILTQGMALELARYRINVNALAPGTIDTDIVQDEHILQVVEAERQQSSIPWGRMGTGEDLVGAAVFLASSDSDYMAGSTVLVDGGCLAGSALPPQFRSRRG